MKSFLISWWVGDDGKAAGRHEPTQFSGDGSSGNSFIVKTVETYGTLKLTGDAEDDHTGVKNVLATFEGNSTDPAIEGKFAFVAVSQ